jgi:hypothetical protein
MGNRGGANRVLVWRPEGKRTLGRRSSRWEDNIKMDLKEVGWRLMDWIDLTLDRDMWLALVNAVIKLRVTQNARNFLTSCRRVSR